MNHSRHKILFVGGFPPPGSQIFGGQVTACRALMASAFATDFEVTTLDSTQISNPPPGLLVRGLLAGIRVLRFIWLLLTVRPDAVLLFAGVGASLVEKGVMGWIARAFGRPVMFFPRGAEVIEVAASSKWRGFFIKSALRSASYFLCQGPTWQKFAIEKIGLPEKRAPIIANWTATRDLLAIGEARRERANAQQQLLFLGWLEEEKGVFELIDAVAPLCNKHNLKLVLAGRGHAEEATRQQVAAAGIEAHVEFAGWVRGDALNALLSASDIFVPPSWAEGLPNAMIEAMSAQLAVVVSAVGNIPDFATDEETALLVPPRNSEALKRAVERLLSDAALRKRIAAGGHDLARRQFSIEPAVEKLSSIVKAIAAKGHN